MTRQKKWRWLVGGLLAVLAVAVWAVAYLRASVDLTVATGIMLLVILTFTFPIVRSESANDQDSNKARTASETRSKSLSEHLPYFLLLLLGLVIGYLFI